MSYARLMHIKSYDRLQICCTTLARHGFPCRVGIPSEFNFSAIAANDSLSPPLGFRRSDSIDDFGFAGAVQTCPEIAKSNGWPSLTSLAVSEALTASQHPRE